MRIKLLFLLFLAFSLLLPLSAQVRLGNFTQQGGATQDLKDEGFAAAHPSLPLNSPVKVTNTANGKEVEVKITNRISVSSNRIIDLSAAAYKALELKKGDTVVISLNAAPAAATPPRVAAAGAENTSSTAESRQTQSSEAAQPAASAPLAASAQPAASTQPASVQTITAAPGVSGGYTTVSPNPAPGINVVVTTTAPVYTEKEAQNDRIVVVNPSPSPPQSNSGFMAWLMVMSMEAREARNAREEREIRDAREAREVRLAREERESREEREVREARLARERRESREEREAWFAFEGIEERAYNGN